MPQHYGKSPTVPQSKGKGVEELKDRKASASPLHDGKGKTSRTALNLSAATAPKNQKEIVKEEAKGTTGKARVVGKEEPLPKLGNRSVSPPAKKIEQPAEPKKKIIVSEYPRGMAPKKRN